MPEGRFEDLHGVPSWDQYRVSILSIFMSVEEANPDDTLFLQLDVQEVALVAFSLLVTQRLFPELSIMAGNLSAKITELAGAQEFLSGPEEGEGE